MWKAGENGQKIIVGTKAAAVLALDPRMHSTQFAFKLAGIVCLPAKEKEGDRNSAYWADSPCSCPKGASSTQFYTMAQQCRKDDFLVIFPMKMAFSQ
jgi:hypothetical protein